MDNDRTLAIVSGYHECSYPPPKAYDAGLTNRFAVVFDNYRLVRVDWFFDAELFVRVLNGICQVITHDSLTIEMDAGHDLHTLQDLSDWCRTRAEDDREPPTRVSLYHRGRLVTHAETEAWAFVGGPAPYHDSYTLSFYTPEDRSEEFRTICERISKEMGAAITGCYKAMPTKEPFTPLWKTPLKWLGVKPW